MSLNNSVKITKVITTNYIRALEDHSNKILEIKLIKFLFNIDYPDL